MSVRFATDFEASTDDAADCLPPFFDQYRQGNGLNTQMTIRSDVPGAVSPKAARLVLPPANGSNCRLLNWPAYRLPYGMRRWIGTAVFFGDDWVMSSSQINKDSDSFCVILNITTAGSGPGGGFGLEHDTNYATPARLISSRGQGHSWTDGKGEDRKDLGPAIKNEWIYLNQGTLWTNASSSSDKPNAEYWRKDSTTGHVWKRVAIRTAQTSVETTTSQQARWGIYEGSAVNHSRTIWFDKLRIADTFEEADPSHGASAPATPTGLRVVSVGDGRVALDWNDTDLRPGDQYELEIY